MKKLMIMMVVLGSVAFGRDLTYNEKRDIINPMEETIDRMSRFTPMELELADTLRDENIKKYPEFHRDLGRSDQGENSER